MQGPLKTPSKVIFLRILGDFLGPYRSKSDHVGPYGPIWARLGPLKSGKSSGKTNCLNDFLLKIVVFDLQTAFLDGFTVLLSFLAEKWYRTNMKLPQKASFGPEAYEI